LLSKLDFPISVFICHWNNPSDCLRTVQCFLKQKIPLQVSIIDNASEFDKFQFLRENLPSKVELIRLKENRGYAGGLNVLLNRWLKHGKGDFCFVSAHDALPQDGCLEMLLESMLKDEKIGIAYAEENGVPCVPAFHLLRGPIFLRTSPRPPGTIEQVKFCYGPILLFRKQALMQIGLFDERYFTYEEDIEIGLRAQKFGWKVVIVRGAIVVNLGKSTPSDIACYLQLRNILLMIKEYSGCHYAILRSLISLGNTVLLLLWKSRRPVNFSTYARLRAIIDFWLGRYGPPPQCLWERKRSR
jgi:N-acetylglucosaminyl-diphospho-decaprenol L-rhamnosyltransferase